LLDSLLEVAIGIAALIFFVYMWFLQGAYLCYDHPGLCS
jgi:hypothetical protein